MIILHTAVSIVLIALILLQQEGGGTLAFRGFGASYHTKRGAEKLVFILTIVFAVVFIGLAVLNLVLFNPGEFNIQN